MVFTDEDRLEHDRIFVATRDGLDGIILDFIDIADRVAMKDDAKQVAKELALHANYLGADISKIVVTSTQRTETRQAEVMVPYLTDTNNNLYRRVRDMIYEEEQEDGNTYYEQFKNGIITKDELKNIAYELSLEDIQANKTAYRHVREDEKTFDIGPKSSGHNTNDIACFNKSIEMAKGKTLDSSSLGYNQLGEKSYHIVLK